MTVERFGTAVYLQVDLGRTFSSVISAEVRIFLSPQNPVGPGEALEFYLNGADTPPGAYEGSVGVNLFGSRLDASVSPVVLTDFMRNGLPEGLTDGLGTIVFGAGAENPDSLVVTSVTVDRLELRVCGTVG